MPRISRRCPCEYPGGRPGGKNFAQRPSKSWKYKRFGADIHDPQARTAKTPGGVKKLRAKFFFPHEGATSTLSRREPGLKFLTGLAIQPPVSASRALAHPLSGSNWRPQREAPRLRVCPPRCSQRSEEKRRASQQPLRGPLYPWSPQEDSSPLPPYPPATSTVGDQSYYKHFSIVLESMSQKLHFHVHLSTMRHKNITYPKKFYPN